MRVTMPGGPAPGIGDGAKLLSAVSDENTFMGLRTFERRPVMISARQHDLHRVDRSRVCLDSPVQTLYWTVKLGATENELRRAVLAVGDDPQAVARFARGLRSRRLARS